MTVLMVVCYIALGLVAVCLVLLAVLGIDTMFAKPSDCRLDLYCVVHRRGGSVTHRLIQHHEIHSVKLRRRAVLWLPGILAREDQIDPIVSLFADRDVYAVRYAGRRYDGPDVAVPQATVILHMLANIYDEIMVIGASHGGMLGTEAIDGLDAGSKSKISLFVVFDAPTGAEDIMSIHPLAEPILTWFKPGILSNIAFFWVLPLINRLSTPKELTIIRPNPVNLRRLGLPQDMLYKEYVAWVQRSAKASLSGHYFSMWYSEIRDMVESGWDGLPFGSLHGIDVMYIKCLRNDMIQQPEAANTWKDQADAHVFSVNMPHCAMLENLDEIINLVGVAARYR